MKLYKTDSQGNLVEIPEPTVKVHDAVEEDRRPKPKMKMNRKQRRAFLAMLRKQDAKAN